MIRTRLADGFDVPKGDRLQPVDADMNTVRLVASGDIQILAAWGAGADEDRVEALRPTALFMLSTGVL